LYGTPATRVNAAASGLAGKRPAAVRSAIVGLETDPAALAHLRHDLRTPLNHIIGYSEMLLEELEGDDAAGLAPGLTQVLEGGRRVLASINDRLSASRVEAGTVDLAGLPAAVAGPLGEILVEAAALADRAGESEALRSDLERIAGAAARLQAMVQAAAGEGAAAAERETAADADDGPRDGAPGDKGLVLVVDDSESNRDLLARRLARQGYEVRLAAGGQQALRVLAGQAVDVVLLDVMMPDLDGYEVLARMKADRALREIPVLMVSAVDDIASVVRCIEMGADDYLPKPFDPVLLRARVGACLEKKRLRDLEMRQAAELAEWNRVLEQRVQEQVTQLERLWRLDSELSMAQDIQRSMLPGTALEPTPEHPVRLAALLEPARQVGGDLYDYFFTGDGTFCCLVGDVSDKGVPAALFMARTKTLVRVVATLSRSGASRPLAAHEIVAAVNDELARDNSASMFVTAVLAMLDVRSGELEVVNAGHGQPYLLRGGGAVEAAASPRCPPLGVRRGLAFRSQALRLAPGDGVFLYTDGITEAMNPAGELLGEDALAATLAAAATATPASVLAAVLEHVRGFAADAPQSDDIAAVAFRLAR
jgi:sigma-B regulation protein RsbU (phosphoserine phosphatase)